MAHATPVTSDIANLKRGECESCTITASSHNPKDYPGALRTSSFSRSARSTQQGRADGASIGIPGEIEGAGRYRNGVETIVSLALGVRGYPEPSLPRSVKYFEILVSAAGLEPATHALKEPAGLRLPRIFNNLRSPESLQTGEEGWWSGLDRHTHKHWRARESTRRTLDSLLTQHQAFRPVRLQSSVLPVGLNQTSSSSVSSVIATWRASIVSV